jgi:hypothetical protein
MSRAEEQALTCLCDWMRRCRNSWPAIVDLDTASPRTIARWAAQTSAAVRRTGPGRRKHQAAIMLQTALSELRAAAERYADIHERAEAERARQKGQET